MAYSEPTIEHIPPIKTAYSFTCVDSSDESIIGDSIKIGSSPSQTTPLS